MTIHNGDQTSTWIVKRVKSVLERLTTAAEADQQERYKSASYWTLKIDPRRVRTRLGELDQ